MSNLMDTLVEVMNARHQARVRNQEIIFDQQTQTWRLPRENERVIDVKEHFEKGLFEI